MFDTIRVRLFTVEVNLVLWLIALGAVLSADVKDALVWPVVAGFVFAAVWQHQTFYQRRRERKAAQPTPAPDVA